MEQVVPSQVVDPLALLASQVLDQVVLLVMVPLVQGHPKYLYPLFHCGVGCLLMSSSQMLTVPTVLLPVCSFDYIESWSSGFACDRYRYSFSYHLHVCLVSFH